VGQKILCQRRWTSIIIIIVHHHLSIPRIISPRCRSPSAKLCRYHCVYKKLALHSATTLLLVLGYYL